MRQTWIEVGSRSVCVTEDCGRVTARKYVGNREVATLQSWTGKTVAGAKKWADKVLAECRAS